MFVPPEGRRARSSPVSGEGLGVEGQGKSLWSVWFFFSLHCGLDEASGGEEPDCHRSLFFFGPL